MGARPEPLGDKQLAGLCWIRIVGERDVGVPDIGGVRGQPGAAVAIDADGVQIVQRDHSFARVGMGQSMRARGSIPE